MARRDQVLYRDTDDKMIAGVCSGVGHYFDVDTTLVRVAFVVMAMLGGGGILAYAFLWIALDPAPADYWGEADAVRVPDVEAGDVADLTRDQNVETGGT